MKILKINLNKKSIKIIAHVYIFRRVEKKNTLSEKLSKFALQGEWTENWKFS